MLPEAGELAARVRAGGLRVDAGCGPGNYLAALGRPAVALDAAHAMLVLAREAAPDVPGVQADLEALPFRRGALAGAWARNSYLHVPKARLPLALARLHDALRVDAPLALTLISGDREGESFSVSLSFMPTPVTPARLNTSTRGGGPSAEVRLDARSSNPPA